CHRRNMTYRYRRQIGIGARRRHHADETPLKASFASRRNDVEVSLLRRPFWSNVQALQNLVGDGQACITEVVGRIIEAFRPGTDQDYRVQGTGLTIGSGEVGEESPCPSAERLGTCDLRFGGYHSLGALRMWVGFLHLAGIMAQLGCRLGIFAFELASERAGFVG